METPSHGPDAATSGDGKKKKVASTDRLCANIGCDNTGANKRCKRCRAVVYCSQGCQAQHWRAGNHRSFCKPFPTASGAQRAPPTDHVSPAGGAGAAGCDGGPAIPDWLQRPPGGAAARRSPASDDAPGGAVPNDRVVRVPRCLCCGFECRPGSACFRCGQVGSAAAEASAEVPPALRLAADQGDPAAQHRLATLFYCTGRLPQAMQWFHRAAEAGSGQAQCFLGVLFTGSLGSSGVARDYAKSLRYLSLAADKGLAAAQFQLGMLRKECNDAPAESERPEREDDAAAARWFGLAAGQGNTLAQLFLGTLYLVGSPTLAKDLAKALHFVRAAAADGLPMAQCQLAGMHRDGVGVAEDPSEAMRLFKLAAAQGDGTAHRALGDFYTHGYGTLQDFDKAVECFEAAEALGKVGAQEEGYELIAEEMRRAAKGLSGAVRVEVTGLVSADHLNDKRGTIRPYATVGAGRVAVSVDGQPKPHGIRVTNLRLVRPAEPEHPCPICWVNEDTFIEMEFGMCNECGAYICGVCNNGAMKECSICRASFSKTKAETFEQLLRLAAREPGRHTQYAHYKLGGIYMVGDGVEPSYSESLRHTRLAAELGHTRARYNLGLLARNKNKFDEALRHFRIAADQGHPGALCNIAFMHQHGVGVKRDFVEMVRLYRHAAVRKHAPAQCCLGDAYLLGQGVPVDHDEAKRWFRLAADQGDDIARERLDTHRQWGTRRYSFDIQEGVAEVGAMSAEGITQMAARYSAYINGTDRPPNSRVKTSW